MLPLIALLAHLHQVMGADSLIGLLHVRWDGQGGFGHTLNTLICIALCALRLPPGVR